MEVEAALKAVTAKSIRWQLEKSTLMIVFCYLAYPLFHYSNVFVGWTPPHHCHISTDLPLNQTIPYFVKNDEQIRDQCHMYVTSSVDNNTIVSNETTGCHGYVYDADRYTSIVTLFDLVCDKGYISAFSQTCYFFGVLCGSFLFPFVSDLFGRKPTAIVCICLAGVTCLFTLSITNAYSYLAIRFFSGAFIHGSSLSQFTLNTELVPASKRSLISCYLFVWFSVYASLMALIGYIFTDWRHIIILLSSVCFLSILAIRFTEESVPWLVANGQGREAVIILQKAAKRNRATLPEENIDDVMTVAERDGSHRPEEGRHQVFFKRIRSQMKMKCSRKKHGEADIGVIEIFKHPKLRLWTCIMAIVWLNTNTIYYGLTFSSTSLVGNRFVNYFLSSVIEFPAALCSKFMLDKFGRRLTVLICYVSTGVCIMISNTIPKHANGVNLIPLVMTVVTLGKLFISTAYCAIYIYTSELYPTNFRNRGVGMNSVFGRFGSMLAPFAEVLARKSIVLLALVLGVSAIVNGILVLPLPETKNQPLPETMDDIMNLSRGAKMCSCRRRRRDDVTHDKSQEMTELNSQTLAI